MAWGQETLALLAAKGHQVNDLSRGSWPASYEAAMKARRHLDALVVVGGDGMVHLGLQVCAEKKLPLGIVAAGSGNDLAITLDLPIHHIREAVERIEAGLQGEVARIDLGKLSGSRVELPAAPRYFAAVLSAGIDAAIASYARRLTRPRGPAKYKLATLRELPRYRPYGVTVTVDGITWTQSCTLVAVANSPVFGGGLKISPVSSVTDGMLEFVITEPLSRRDILRMFPKLYDGSHIHDPRVRIMQARKVTISQAVDGAPMPPAFADGELVGGEPLTIEVVPKALHVLGARPR
jgi:diacylglycerol kinase (ATP)